MKISITVNGKPVEIGFKTKKWTLLHYLNAFFITNALLVLLVILTTVPEPTVQSFIGLLATLLTPMLTTVFFKELQSLHKHFMGEDD